LTPEVVAFLRRDGSETEADERPDAVANGIAERWVGSSRPELLDQVIAWNKAMCAGSLSSEVRSGYLCKAVEPMPLVYESNG
jgi:hypothetical protein